jgi:hypothetical protein
MEAIGLLTVALSGQMGGDEEPGAVVPMAGQVELFVEVEELADEVAELEAASGERDTVGFGAPGPVRIAQDGESHQWHGMPLADAVQVVVEPPGQVGVALHLQRKMDEQPLIGAIEPANLDEHFGAQRAAERVGHQGADLLFDRGGFGCPIDEFSNRRKGEFPEGPKELVEGLLPRAVVVDDIWHPTQAFACRWLILRGILKTLIPQFGWPAVPETDPPVPPANGHRVRSRSGRGYAPPSTTIFSAENFC